MWVCASQASMRVGAAAHRACRLLITGHLRDPTKKHNRLKISTSAIALRRRWRQAHCKGYRRHGGGCGYSTIAWISSRDLRETRGTPRMPAKRGQQRRLVLTMFENTVIVSEVMPPSRPTMGAHG